MTKKERIEALEREVADLKARPVYAYPYVSVPSAWINYGQCPTCGGANTMGHACYRWYTTTTNDVVDTTSGRISNVTYIGAAS